MADLKCLVCGYGFFGVIKCIEGHSLCYACMIEFLGTGINSLHMNYITEKENIKCPCSIGECHFTKSYLLNSCGKFIAEKASYIFHGCKLLVPLNKEKEIYKFKGIFYVTYAAKDGLVLACSLCNKKFCDPFDGFKDHISKEECEIDVNKRWEELIKNLEKSRINKQWEDLIASLENPQNKISQ